MLSHMAEDNRERSHCLDRVTIWRNFHKLCCIGIPVLENIQVGLQGQICDEMSELLELRVEH